MEQIAAQNVLILLVTSFLFAKGQPVLSIPNPGNHGDTTVLECTQAGFLEANGFSWEKDTVLIYSNLGEATTSGKYSGSSTIGSFSLNILTTEKSDEGMYRCIYIVTGSNTKMLVFESKFSGANLVASSQDKQLVLQIKKIYPSNPTVAVTCDTKAIPGAYISTPNTAVSTLFDLEWTSTQTLDVGDHSCNINVITVSTVDFTTPITITGTTTTTTTPTSTPTPTTTATTTTPTMTTTTTTTPTAPTTITTEIPTTTPIITGPTATTTPATTMTPTAPTPTVPTTGNKDGQSTTLIIVLSVVGGVFILGIIGALLILYFRSKHGSKASKKENTHGSRSHSTRSGKHLRRIPIERNYNIPAVYKGQDPYKVYNQYAMPVQYMVPDQNDRVYGRKPATHSGFHYYNGYNTSQQAVTHVKTNPMFVESTFDNPRYMPKVKKERYGRDSHYHEQHRDSRNNWNCDYSGNWD